MKVVGLFAGIGGIELGLQRAGHQTVLLCENDPGARAVLQARFPTTVLHDDVSTLESLPMGTDLVTAGFPCQDLSQAGRTRGTHITRSPGKPGRLNSQRVRPLGSGGPVLRSVSQECTFMTFGITPTP